MSELTNLINKDFIIVDLGAANASDMKRLRRIQNEITLIELDFTTESKTEASYYHKRISLKKAISGSKNKRIFYERENTAASSFLQPDVRLLQDYGLQDRYKLISSKEVECITLQDLLSFCNLHRVDFLKTDLEGIDYEVLSSAPAVLQSTLVIQSELRFQPFFQGEPSLFMVGNYLNNLGFELIYMVPETWKYRTPRRHLMRDGRLVFADAIFFLSPDRVEEIYKADAPKAFVKQILIASSLGLLNYGEYLYEKIRGNLSSSLINEIDEYVRPTTGTQLGLIRAANYLSRLKGGARFLAWLRETSIAISQSAGVYLSGEHLGPIMPKGGVL